MIKKIFAALVLVLGATSLLAQSGSSCYDPIPVDSNYVGRVNGPCTLWYTAWTYDLPLKVHFTPDSDNSDWGPEVSVDLTCVPGQYADPKLDSLVHMVEDFDVSFPIELLCNMVTSSGKVEWDLSINDSYRKQMAEFGITYNVQAFVKVTFYEAGEIRLKPDTAFTSCMENLQYVNLGDTLDIAANDENTAYVFPYTDWQNDSIRFVWIGEQSARVWLGTMDCGFIPEVNNGFVWGYYDVKESSPKKLYTQNMKDAIKDSQSGGLFYAKITAPVAGKFVVEKIPMSAAQDGAILLEYGKTVQIDTNALYCFPRTWTSTRFVSPTEYVLTMYASPSYDFKYDSEDCYIYPFSKEVDGRVLNLSSTEISVVTDMAVDDYVYVRFACNASISITPEIWDPSECADQSTLIRPNEAFGVMARSSKTIFRMRYADWIGYDLTIQWGGNVKLPTYIADACSFTLSSTNSHVLKYAEVKSKGTFDISAATIDTWASRVDEDGYLYVRFNPTNQGPVVFASAKPEDVDPVKPDPVYSTISETLCYGDSYTWNGQTYSATGDYQQTLVAANGADSIVTLKLTILPEVPATTEKAEIIAGETYTWNGKDYTEAGEYTITLQDKNGCDYQATLILNVLPPLSPCLQASVKLNVGDELKVNLASAFTVYAIDYNAWMQQAVTLVWTGVEPLHTFVAETCEFALAPYNRYVHAYVPVPAQGDWVLDMNALAPYVDEDGYLYVRFLTEFEGTLRVK